MRVKKISAKPLMLENKPEPKKTEIDELSVDICLVSK